MMKVQTKAYGEIEIEEKQKILFPRGLFGFEGLRSFALLDAAQPPFYWLQSLEKVEVAFVLIDPLLFRPDYSADVDAAEIAELDLRDPEDELVFSIVTIPETASAMTANLQGPVIINRRAHVGRQFISTNPLWGIRHGIVDEMNRARQGASC
jgi:flagellar assembly factor FliW